VIREIAALRPPWMSLVAETDGRLVGFLFGWVGESEFGIAAIGCGRLTKMSRPADFAVPVGVMSSATMATTFVAFGRCA
jgi:bisphosphoglycerate-independent phosphoglycerate mutase (AlkP superfamily)